MHIVVYTQAEMEAYRLVGHGWNTTGVDMDAEVSKACDKIIALAEQIKSSRARATMQYSARAALINGQ